MLQYFKLLPVKRLLLFFYLLIINQFLSAQSFFTIVGNVIDSDKRALDLAQITIKEINNNSNVISKYSDSDGSFEFSKIKEGKYLLVANYLGYEEFKKEFTAQGDKSLIDLGQITLVSKALNLNEVKVVANTNYIERKIDRTIVNVDALISNAGTNVLEALEKAPGISVDQNGLIRLKGKAGVQVYIDDKPTYLSGAELENYLKSIPSSNVKQIEIMTNPPAKYEAAGNSGVINIITKRSRIVGISGNLSTSLQQGRYTRSNNSFNLNYNKNKLSISTSINGGFRNSFQDLNINRYYKDDLNQLNSSFAQNSFIVKDGQSANLKLNFDYYLNSRTTIGASLKGLISPNGDQTDNKAFVRNSNNSLSRNVNADNNTRNDFNNETYTMYLKKVLDSSGSVITFDADFVRYTSESNQVFKNFIYDSLDQLIYKDRINGLIPSSINIYALKSDYVKPFRSGLKFESGIKSAFTKTDNEAIYTTTIDTITINDYNLSNRFKYDEWIHAAYINLSKNFGRIDLQAGLRGEATQLKGNQLGNLIKPDTSFTRKYFNLFPTFFAQCVLDSAGIHSINFSYGRRIDRPFFQDLNPFVSPLDKFTFYSGNPNLLPTYAHNFSLSHSYKAWLNTSLNYSKTLDGINETLEIVNGIYFSRPGNISTNHTYSISSEMNKEITKWYRLISYLEYGYLIYKSKLYTETLDSEGDYQYASITNSFTLGKGWNAELRGEYQSEIVYAQLLIKSFGTLNVGFQKSLLKNKATLKINLSDILYTRRADGIIYNLRNTDADWNSRLDTRSVTVAFSYRFGKSSKKQKYIGTGSESEQKRVKG